MIRVPVILLLIALCTGGVDAQTKRERRNRAKRAEGPKPTVADLAYGNDSERQKLDFWKAESDEPAPLVVFIHGGGWSGGDKQIHYRDVQQYLDAGISAAAINYRYVAQGKEQGVKPPVKAPLHDAARAIQTIRSKAKEWNIDPDRVAATGGSAGACTSLWLAFHDDLAQPESDDPIARESTRLTCAAVVGAQTSLDPQQVRQWISNAHYGAHAFGYGDRTEPGKGFNALLAERDKAMPWIKEYSPIEQVSKDDPPVYLDYPRQEAPPKEGQEEKDPTHSAMYGVKLAEKMRDTGVEVVLAYPQHPDTKYGSPAKFIITKLRGAGAARSAEGS